MTIMNALEVKYSFMSDTLRRKSDRIQLILASFALLMSTIESMKDFSGLLKLIPLSTFIVTFANVGIVIGYRWFENKYGDQFEATVLRINGVMMLIVGLSLQFIGNHRVQYVYYLISIFYFIVLPAVMKKNRNRRTIRFSPEKIVVGRWIRKPVETPWSDVAAITGKNELLQIKMINRKKKKKYYLIFDEKNTQFDLTTLLELKQKEYHFSLEYA